MQIAKTTTLLAVVLLGGCAQYQWQKSGVSQQDFERDNYQCQIEAAQAYPVAMVTTQTSAGYLTPSTTNCYGSAGSASCITTPGRFVPPTFMTTDVNAGNRDQTAGSCMRARGWELVRVD